MANYTIELYKLLDTESEFHQSIKNAWDSINFDDDYNNEHREKLFEDFKAKYYFSEIGFETPAIFVIELRNKMREVHNKYNSRFLFLSELISREIDEKGKVTVITEYGKKTKYNQTQDLTESHSGTDQTTGDLTKTGTEHESSENRSIKDSTPEKGININTEFNSNTYADELNHSKSSNDITFTNRNDHSVASVNHGEIIGTTGTLRGGLDELTGSDKVTTEKQDPHNMFDELEKFKNALFNLDNEFIEEFKDLFMRVF